MKKEDKELLLKDLCGRLPYGVKANYQNSDDELLREVTIMYRYLEPNGMVMTGDIKPYLFPLSSMTEGQEDEWCDVCLQPLIKRLDRHTRKEDLMLYAESQYAGSDWLNKNHFDYRGLIEKGLAIDATGLGIYE